MRFRSVPSNYQELLKTDAESWNFNFRPYDRHSAELLWTDPSVIRDALDGLDMEGNVPTAIHVSCDELGMTFLFFAGDAGFSDAIGEGKLPRFTIEMFFEPGTAETTSIEPYYQMIIDMLRPVEGRMIFNWLTEDRSFRSLEPYVSIDSRFLPNGVLTRLFVPWIPLFDRLPFTDKRDNLWRLSVIRWGARGGGQTWGGLVHSHSGAGYMRFPAFTPAQKTKIRKNVLQAGWIDFQAHLNLPHYNPNLVKPPSNPMAVIVANRSYMNYNEDFGFREFWLENAVEERMALGNGIADFEKMSREEQESFYEKASDMLFNFRYDVEEAYGAYMNAQLFRK